MSSLPQSSPRSTIPLWLVNEAMEINQQSMRTQLGITWENPTQTSPWDPTGCIQEHRESWPTSLQSWSLLFLKAHGDQVVSHDWRRANVVSIFRKSQKVNPGNSKSHFDHWKKFSPETILSKKKKKAMPSIDFLTCKYQHRNQSIFSSLKSSKKYTKHSQHKLGEVPGLCKSDRRWLKQR